MTATPPACTTLQCRIPLPAGYRQADFLLFHRRDSEAVAERVTPESLTKGLLWQGGAACMTITFAGEQADVRLALDDPLPVSMATQTKLERRARLMLGLSQSVEAFERRHGSHAQIGALVRTFAGLRIPVAASAFEALSWAIIGQQISVGAAISIRRRLVQAAGSRHSSGLWCFPQAHQVATLTHDELRAVGLSAGKARTFSTLCAALAAGDLSLDNENGSAEALGAQLLQIKGIGPWTVNYTLMRGFGWLDGSLHGDVAVRRSLQRLLGLADRPSEAQTKAWLAGFSPWRALVAAHLWAFDASPES